MRQQIFSNIKRWLIEYGIDILDIILEPTDRTSRVTTKRYDNFMHELNRHFSSHLYYQSNFYSHLPLLTLEITNVGSPNSCYCDYMLTFRYNWTTISADQENHMENTPEALMEMEDSIAYLLSKMMKSKILINNRVVTRTVFTDMLQIPGFEYKISNVASIEEYPHVMKQISVMASQNEEINTLTKQFRVTIGECN